jgi:hypothetical protein
MQRLADFKVRAKSHVLSCRLMRERVRGAADRGQHRQGFFYLAAYHSRRSAHWLKVKNPNAPAVMREAEEDWGR